MKADFGGVFLVLPVLNTNKHLLCRPRLIRASSTCGCSPSASRCSPTPISMQCHGFVRRRPALLHVRELCPPAPRMAATPKQPYRAHAAGQGSHSDLPCGWVSWTIGLWTSAPSARPYAVRGKCSRASILSLSASFLCLSTLEPHHSILEKIHHYHLSYYLSNLA